MSDRESKNAPGRSNLAAPSPEKARIIESEKLLNGARSVEIVHGGQIYRLIRTRNDKLILTK